MLQDTTKVMMRNRKPGTNDEPTTLDMAIYQARKKSDPNNIGSILDPTRANKTAPVYMTHSKINSNRPKTSSIPTQIVSTKNVHSLPATLSPNPASQNVPAVSTASSQNPPQNVVPDLLITDIDSPVKSEPETHHTVLHDLNILTQDETDQKDIDQPSQEGQTKEAPMKKMMGSSNFSTYKRDLISTNLIHYLITGCEGWQQIWGFKNPSNIQPIQILRNGNLCGLTFSHPGADPYWGMEMITAQKIYICRNMPDVGVPEMHLNFVMAIIHINGSIKTPTSFTIIPNEKIIVNNTTAHWEVISVACYRNDKISIYATNLLDCSLELFFD